MNPYQSGSFSEDHEIQEHQNQNGLNREPQFNYTVHKYSQPTMEFKGEHLSGQIIYDSNSDMFILNGQFPRLARQGNPLTLKYWAANPIIRNYSYVGSGLPYPNPDVAYENTPNQGEVGLDGNGAFTMKLNRPSAYYLRQGKILIKPHVHISIPAYDEVFTIAIADDFPYRSLKNFPDQPNRSIGR